MSRSSIPLLLVAFCLAGQAFHAQALPPESVAAWKADIETLRTTYLAEEFSFTAEARTEFLSHMDELEAALPELSREQAVVRLCRAVALTNNGHSMVFLNKGEQGFGRLPLGVWWFEDGLYVTRARPEYEKLVGNRVTAIAGVAPEELLVQVGELIAGSPGWKRYHSQHFMITPGILHGLGLTGTPDSVEITVDDAGAPLSQHVTGDPSSRLDEEGRFWWTVSPVAETGDGPWIYAFNPKAAKVPLYLAQPNLAFTHEFLEEENALYVQYNRSFPQRGLWPVRTIRAIGEEVEKRKIKRLIIDLRMNTGGNYYKMKGGFDDLLALDAFKKPGSVFVLTSNATFSAAIYHTAQLRIGGATIVGEHVGDYMDFWAEGDSIVLPGIGLEVTTNNGYHAYSTTPHPEYAEQLHTDLEADTLEPGIPVSMTFADYIAGRDPLLEAALSAP